MRQFFLKLTSSLWVLGLVTVTSADQIQWASSLEQARALAAQQNKLLLIHFYTPECAPCRGIDRNVFPNPMVAQTINQYFVPLKVNANENTELRDYFRVRVWPTDVIATVDGKSLHQMVTPQQHQRYAAALVQAYGRNAPATNRTMVAQQPQPQTAIAAQPQTAAVPPSAAAVTQPPVSMPAAAQPRVPQSQYAAGAQYVAAQPAVGNQYPNQPPAQPQHAVQTPMQQVPGQQAQRGPMTVPQSQQVQPQQPVQPQYAAAPRQYVAPQVAAPPQVASPQVPMQPAVSATVAAQPQPPMAQAAQQAQPQQPPVDVTPIQEPTPIGLDGRCPVTLISQNKWRVGDKRWGAVHRGKTYLFAGPEEQRMFLDNPDDYSPVLAGMDVVRLAGTGQVIEGTRRYGVLFDDDGKGPNRSRIYLFDSVDSRNQFEADPKVFLEPVMQAMRAGSLDTLLR